MVYLMDELMTQDEDSLNDAVPENIKYRNMISEMTKTIKNLEFEIGTFKSLITEKDDEIKTLKPSELLFSRKKLANNRFIFKICIFLYVNIYLLTYKLLFTLKNTR